MVQDRDIVTMEV